MEFVAGEPPDKCGGPKQPLKRSKERDLDAHVIRIRCPSTCYSMSRSG